MTEWNFWKWFGLASQCILPPSYRFYVDLFILISESSIALLNSIYMIETQIITQKNIQKQTI